MLHNFNIGYIQRISKVAGTSITKEPVKLGIEGIGNLAVAPVALIMSPGYKTKKEVNEKKYQALRLVMSVVITYAISVIVAALAIKTLSRAAWQRYLPPEMQSKLRLNTSNLKSVKDIFARIGANKVPKNTETNFDLLLKVSQLLKRTEAKIQRIQKKIEVIIEPYLNNSSKLASEKSLVKKVDALMAGNKDFALKHKDIDKLKRHYVALKQVTRKINNASTKLIQDIKESGSLAPKELAAFEKLVEDHPTESFVMYRQLMQTIITILTFPAAAYTLNSIFPVLAKKTAPQLSKEVEEANRL